MKIHLPNRVVSYLSDTRPLGLLLRKRSKEPVSLSAAVGNLQDAFLRRERGASLRRGSQIALKIGAMKAFTGGLLGSAALFGTASTGTAISTLSGAAFTSAALAWIGGSVAVGTAILTAGSLVVGVAGFFGAKRAWRRWVVAGERERASLDAEEQAIASALDQLLIVLRRLEMDTSSQLGLVEPLAYEEVLTPSLDKIERKLAVDYGAWPLGSRQKLKSAVRALRVSPLRERADQPLAIPMGVTAAVILKLAHGNEHAFSDQEELVVEAIRRSDNDLATATVEEIGTYLRSLVPAQLRGLRNNVKGIYHELAFAEAENLDSDQYAAELFGATNHPGSDIRLVNLTTGEVEELQLKATDSVSAIAEHMDRYASVALRVTEELASQRDDLVSSGFSNAELSEDVRSVVHELQEQGTLEDALGTSAETALTASLVAFLLSAGKAIRGGQPVGSAVTRAADQSGETLRVAGVVALLSELCT